MTPRREEVKSAVQIAATLSAIADPAARRDARIAYREEVVKLRFRARQFKGIASMADTFAKFGGGSLLTGTLLLMFTGKTATPVIFTFAFALLIFLMSTIFWFVMDQRTAAFDHAADRLDAVLKETER